MDRVHWKKLEQLLRYYNGLSSTLLYLLECTQVLFCSWVGPVACAVMTR